jgi:hypothetical protein
MSIRFSRRIQHKETLNRIDEAFENRIKPAFLKAQHAQYRVYLAESKFNLPDDDPQLIARKEQLQIAEEEFFSELRFLRAITNHGYYGLDKFQSYWEVIDFKKVEMNKDQLFGPSIWLKRGAM